MSKRRGQVCQLIAQPSGFFKSGNSASRRPMAAISKGAKGSQRRSIAKLAAHFPDSTTMILLISNLTRLGRAVSPLAII